MMVILIGDEVPRERMAPSGLPCAMELLVGKVIGSQSNGPSAIAWLVSFHPFLGILIETQQV
jgi:hypothetical protein